MPKTMLFLTTCLTLAVLLALRRPAGEESSAGDEHRDPAPMIIAMERAALNKSDKGDPSGFLDISAPDVTYFDPFLEQPIHGLEALRTYYSGFPSDERGSGEMSNVKVQMEGDGAVLTFNYVFRFENSERTTRWNTTEVYRRTKDGWRIIHTHWSFMKPALAP